MKFLVQKIDGKLMHDFAHEIMVSQTYAKWRGEPYTIKYVEKYVPKDLKHPEKYIPIGTVEFVTDYILTYFPDKMSCLKPLNVPDCLKEFAGRSIWDIKKKSDIPAEMKSKFVYRKSLEKIKDPSNGMIHYDGNQNDILGYQVSTEIHDILSEWRVFVHNGKIMQACYYDGDPLTFPDRSRIEEMVDRYNNNGAPSNYTIDVFVNDNGTFVMECHRFFSCGLYGFSDYRVLPYMFSQAWHEILYSQMVKKI